MMIVQCQACKTRFRVDESRIQGRGARMRCRRCGEAIIVMKESASRTGPPSPKNLFDLRAVLRQPERKPPRVAEGNAADTPSREPKEPEASVPPPAPLATPPEPEAPAAWEPPAEESAGPAAEEEAPEVASPDEADSLRIPGEPTPEEAPEAEPEAAEPSFPEPEEPVAEEPHPPEPEAPAAWEPPAEEPAGPAAEEEAPEVASPDESEIPQDPGLTTAWEPPAEKEEAPAREEDPPPPESPSTWKSPVDEEKPFELLLNDSDTLDFLKEDFSRTESNGELDISGILRSDPVPDPEPGEISLPTVPPGSASPDEPIHDRLEAIQRELQEIGGGTPDPVPLSPPSSPAEPPPVPPVRKAPPLVPGVAKRPGKPAVGRPSLVPLAILFFLIAGGGAYLGFTPGGQKILRRAVPVMESLWLGKETAEARYAVGNLVGYYEPNARAGNLFVIQGTVTNRGRKKRSGIRVHAELFGAGGTPLAGKTAFAGNVFSAESLRSSSREAIEKGMSNRWGDTLSNLDVASGKSIPFMVVFFDAPAGIEEYRIEARDGE